MKYRVNKKSLQIERFEGFLHLRIINLISSLFPGSRMIEPGYYLHCKQE